MLAHPLQIGNNQNIALNMSYRSHTRIEYNTLINSSKRRQLFKLSKSQTTNRKVRYLYEYIVYVNQLSGSDSDIWHVECSNDVQALLNDFIESDWVELCNDTMNWELDDIVDLIRSVGFGFDGMFHPVLNSDRISAAGNFYLNLFALSNDHDVRDEIIYYSFFIKNSKSIQLNKLKLMSDWMLNYGYDREGWINSRLNPLGNINEAIAIASSQQPI